ncbi:alpha-1,6-mannosyl-glycoprotein 2-beta-N-acetylglucosaminyltransferase [Corythoichthys intestinalis]|uniref:alpha-1,6-mannosyl-glycoprotein 2-beta-N-acetylglucosaminyltransferase n=1 Tax=Corythoichthys intestinalis TaxID=161448 RepID=UPI0025A67791|nr:alpha-1,6-mannosyl-glycoprotein 2-beta-N-acetylglucosaminyltransferase [Corythoichthys intestinalis]XP_061806978.1 alpha-1,6-mannosyl-glycoprotein 2-beta-N-acetylglucosaminyltransferase [Nerophis lumbriciformis]
MRFRLAKKNLLVLLGISFVVWTLLVSTSVLSVSENSTSNQIDKGAHSSDLVKLDFSGSLSKLTKSVYRSNFKQHVLNAERFPGEPQLVLVVQVHNRPEYLQLLIYSLEKAAEVHRFLIIFSHDYFSEEINTIVQGITFCKVLQIYFPFSTQLYPKEFPGQDSRDCPRDIAKDEAIELGCLNAEHPDSYGHYREADVTQTKHHWWWKLHFVWERVQAMQGYSGFVVFLEEENYILPDFFQFYKSMIEFRENNCLDCDFLSLGNHNDFKDFPTLSNKLLTTGWMSVKHSLGIAISREMYYKMMGCSNDFCTYDDYNWHWTLQHLSGNCISKPFKVLVAQGSRILHTGECGLRQKQNCRPEWASQRVEEVLKMVKDSLFPPSLVLTSSEEPRSKKLRNNGGWGDVRDHRLCNNYAKRL